MGLAWWVESALDQVGLANMPGLLNFIILTTEPITCVDRNVVINILDEDEKEDSVRNLQ